jgi:FMN phosphatase YigB (HAD superfamily)
MKSQSNEIQELENLQSSLQLLKKDKKIFSDLRKKQESGSLEKFRLEIISDILRERGIINIDFDNTLVNANYQSMITLKRTTPRDADLLQECKKYNLLGKDAEKLPVNSPYISIILDKLEEKVDEEKKELIKGAREKVAELLKDKKDTIFHDATLHTRALNKELFKELIEKTQDAGLKVAITSFSDVSAYVFYPTMQDIGLSEERIANIYPEMWMPKDPNSSSSTKNEHIEKVVESFRMQYVPKQNICLIDDNENNIRSATNYGYKTIKAPGCFFGLMQLVADLRKKHTSIKDEEIAKTKDFEVAKEAYVREAIKFVEERNTAINKAIDRGVYLINQKIVELKQKENIEKPALPTVPEIKTNSQNNPLSRKIINLIFVFCSGIAASITARNIFKEEGQGINTSFALLTSMFLTVTGYSCYKLCANKSPSFKQKIENKGLIKKGNER